jgi:hypothetical protein
MTLQIDSANFPQRGIDLHNLSSGYVPVIAQLFPGETDPHNPPGYVTELES